ncbi:MAG TPA: hypothetical protein VNO43_01900 [Candidatus Eisenbacteria bacterium]|nr:hypothetical protein [Candidatus Eisenbacteria bacterium]
MRPFRRPWPTFVVVAAMLAAGCENIALIRRPEPVIRETRPAPPPIPQFTGVIEEIDLRLRELQLRLPEGRIRTVSYDSDTRVYIRGREAPVSALRRDDPVTVQLNAEYRGYESARAIQVHEPVEPPRETARVEPSGTQTIEGTVERIDFDRGYFEVRPRFGEEMTRVFLPYNPLRKTEARFRTLREGDYVRVEGELVNDNRVMLKEFL